MRNRIRYTCWGSDLQHYYFMSFLDKLFKCFDKIFKIRELDIGYILTVIANSLKRILNYAVLMNTSALLLIC